MGSRGWRIARSLTLAARLAVGAPAAGAEVSLGWSIFDVVFLAAFFASVVFLVIGAVYAVRGRNQQALRILRRWIIAVLAYLAIGVAVSALTPERVLNPGDRECNDDWCIGVDHFERLPAADGVTYDVTLRIESRARKATQRENGVSVYLRDDRGKRYDAIASSVPFDVLLGPEQWVSARRVFSVPADASGVGLAIDHRTSMGWLIIGSGPLRKPTLVRLTQPVKN